MGRVIKKINPDLTEKEVVYKDQNNYVTIYDELDHYSVCHYDGIGRLTKTEWYLLSDVLPETYIYNYLNKVEMRTDPGGHIYSCESDSRGGEGV